MDHNVQAARLKEMLVHIGRMPEGAAPGHTDGHAEGLAPLSAAAAIRAQLSAEQWSAAGQLLDGHSISLKKMAEIERIVRPVGRPAAIVAHGSYDLGPPWGHLMNNPARATINRALLSVGQIAVPGDAVNPLAGTGFLVGDALVMTNRHVAEIFVQGMGTAELRFRAGMAPVIDFDSTTRVKIEQVVLMHPFWDLALLRVAAVPSHIQPLTLARTLPASGPREIVVIGFPGHSASSPDGPEYEDELRTFGDQYDRKRVQPGQLGPRMSVDSEGSMVMALTHDSSTRGGNSGSPLLDVRTGQVVGLHFDGDYLDQNYAVPSDELARDAGIVAAGVQFA